MAAVTRAAEKTAPQKLLSALRRVGTAGVLISDRLNIYIDPVGAPAGSPKADIIFLTHPHERHYSPKDVEALSTPSTIVAGPKDCVARFRLNQLPLRPGEMKVVMDVETMPVAAYDHEGTDHPRDKDWLGFSLRVGGSWIYHPGDTGWTSELASMHPDVLLWPVSRALSLNSVGRLGLVEYFMHLAPKAVVPVHCGSPEDAANLAIVTQAAKAYGCAIHSLP